MGEAWRRGEWLGGRGGGHSDPTAASAGYRMARAERLESERAELAEIVAEARMLAEGIRRLLGDTYANALTMRYLKGLQWRDVADRLGVCESTARNRVSTALDTIDSMGRANVVMGRGTATD